MFGSTSPFGQSSTSPFASPSVFNAFGQSSTSPFGSPSVFEQSNNESSNPFTPKPFGCTTPFGSPTGGSIFAGPSTGVFGENSLAPAFGVSSAPAFGGPSSICGSSLFDKNPTFGGFASSPNPSNSFGSLFQQSQSAFGSSPFGLSTSLGASTQNVSASSPALGAPSTSPFGVASTQTFGSTGTACVLSNSPAFGFGTASAFGATNTLRSSNTFSEVSNTTGFGASRPPTFGTSSTAGFGFGINPTLGHLSPVSGSSSLFGTATSVFGTQSSSLAQSTTPTFGSPGFGQSAFGGQHEGSRVVAYTATAEVDGGSSTQPAAKLQSISAMHINKDKNHEELRWEDYQLGDKGGPRRMGQSAGEIGIWGSTIRSNTFGPSPALAQSSFNPLHSSTRSNPFNSQTSSASFEAQSTTPTFGTTGFGQLALGGQHRGSRVASYIATAELADDGSSSQSAGKLQSISTMPINKDKTHEELRWEDYQLGDKGGPRHVGQSAGSVHIGGSSIQSNSFGPSPTLAQSSANLFDSSTVSNPVAPQTSSNPFSIPVFSSPFSSRTSSNTFSTQVSSSTYAPKTSSNKFSLCPFAPQSSTVFAPQTSSNTFSFPFTPQTSTIIAPQTPSFSFAPQISSNHFSPQSSSNIFAPKTTAPSSMGSVTTSVSAFGPNSTPLFSPAIVPLPSIFASTSALGTASGFSSSSSQPNVFSASSTGSQLGENLFSDMPSLLSMSYPAGFSQITPSVCTSLQPTQTDQSSAAVQSMAFANAFGAVTAMPQLSVSHCGSTPSIQYGISSMPVLDKPAAPVRMSSLLTSRHLSQRRGRLPTWKHNPKSDGSKVPFFSNDKEMAAALRNDALPVPRENPRASVILPAEQWPQRSNKEKMSPLVSASLHVYKNGKISAELCASGSLNGSICQDEDDRLDKSSTDKDGSSSTKPNDKPNDECHYNFPNKGSFPIKIPRSEATEAATLKEHVADVEALLPRLRLSEYYTEPRISELAVKERTEPGFCSRVKDFVVGRHGYGNIKFLGETDVRQLDLDSHVHFNTREVIVYMDESKKPPLGQGLNKPAEVSLFNVKCINKKTGKQYINGPVVDKYREMLIKKAAEQGAEFVSFDPVGGEWKFKVQHFSQYEFRDDSKCPN